MADQENPQPFHTLFPNVPEELWFLFMDMMGIVSRDLYHMTKRQQDHIRHHIQQAFEDYHKPHSQHCSCRICVRQIEHDMEQTEWPAPHTN